MKEEIKKEHLRRMRKLLKTKLYNRNLIKGINIWAVVFGTILKVDEIRTSINELENKKTHDNA